MFRDPFLSNATQPQPVHQSRSYIVCQLFVYFFVTYGLLKTEFQGTYGIFAFKLSNDPELWYSTETDYREMDKSSGLFSRYPSVNVTREAGTGFLRCPNTNSIQCWNAGVKWGSGAWPHIYEVPVTKKPLLRTRHWKFISRSLNFGYLSLGQIAKSP